jgi:predicted hotdog family 3-hydroxylacyl-ACP dehydratase
MDKNTLLRFDSEILELIPHRPPMLLINRIVSVTSTESEALVMIDNQAPFYEPEVGVPTWIGLEYMGQTAALIAGFQQQKGLISEYLGFLIGSRKYETCTSYFDSGKTLRVVCREAALVGKDLATFECAISELDKEQSIATAMFSVIRKPKL